MPSRGAGKRTRRHSLLSENPWGGSTPIPPPRVSRSRSRIPKARAPTPSTAGVELGEAQGGADRLRQREVGGPRKDDDGRGSGAEEVRASASIGGRGARGPSAATRGQGRARVLPPAAERQRRGRRPGFERKLSFIQSHEGALESQTITLD
jgi:hypothetical protein